MRLSIPVEPGRAALLTGLSLLCLVLSSCESIEEGTASTSAEGKSREVASSPPAPQESPEQEEKSVLPEIPDDLPEVDVSMLIHERNGIQQNLAAMGDMMRSIESEFGKKLLPADDPRRRDPLFARFYSGHRRIHELYQNVELDPRDHLELCNHLQRLGLYFNELATEHCAKFLASEESEEDPVIASRALGVLASLHVKAQRYRSAERSYRQYIERECSLERSNDQLERLPGECRSLLTQNLPFVLHRLKDTEAMELLLEELWAYGFDQPQDTNTLRGYLIQDLWETGNLESLDRITKEVLQMKVWKKRGAETSSRGLVVPALSARSRLLLLRDGCFKARAAYLDYEFEHGEIDPEWRQSNITAPSALMCRPAPPLGQLEWVNGRAPRIVPGAPVPGQVVLLHFIDSSFPLSMTTIQPVHELAERFPEKLQVITLLRRSAKFFNPKTLETSEELDAPAYEKLVEDYAKDAGLSQALATRGVGRAFLDYRVAFYPTLVLLDTSGQVVAYSPGLPLDKGWATLVEKLTETAEAAGE